jgi:hypothetical protein
MSVRLLAETQNISVPTNPADNKFEGVVVKRYDNAIKRLNTKKIIVCLLIPIYELRVPETQ